MSANTDPAGFDPEATGSFNVRSLAEKPDWNAPDRAEVPEARTIPLLRQGPALYYQFSDGQTLCDVDFTAPRALGSADDHMRELMLARALLRHALHLVDKELGQL